jgi:hypothetical protein
LRHGSARTSPGESREILEALIPKLEADANRDVVEAFQDISTAGTFIPDKSLAEMAREVGLSDMYYTVMIPGSSVVHGDWSALGDSVLVRCQHPLHDRHALPRPDYAEESSEQFPYLAETFARWSFDEYCAAVGVEPLSAEDARAEMKREASDADDKKPTA